MKGEYGEKLFGNTTNLSPLIIKEFSIFVLKPMFIKLTIALFAIFMCFSLYGFLTKLLYVGIFMAVASVAVIPAMIFGYNHSMKKSMNSNKLCSHNTFIDYYFEDGGVRSSTRKGDVEIASLAIDYRMISKVVEYSHYYYIFITDTQVYIIDKNGMTEGKSEKLAEFLKTKTKFIESKKQKMGDKK